MLNRDARIVVTGGAGLVGQNLVISLQRQGFRQVCVIDKNAFNLRILGGLQPGVEIVHSDILGDRQWLAKVQAAQVLVLLHAQIGGLRESDFQRNNVDATECLLDAIDAEKCYVLHVSTSAVHSSADDFYTRTKAAQEKLVTSRARRCCVLRPTLMFGWFDRKHFGWLSRFMQRSPFFPVPGSGDYERQPLFVLDFCNVIVRCIEQEITGRSFNISGKQRIPYIRVIQMVKAAIRSRTLIVRLPYTMFHLLLRVYAWFDSDPPFTVSQLRALVIDEVFEDTDWESQFGVTATPLEEALELTFNHPQYSSIALQF